MNKISNRLLLLLMLIITNLNGQEIDFANRFSLDKFDKMINKEINRQIRKKGYKEMKNEGVERYFIYNLSRNNYASWESLRDYSFLDSCELRTYMDFDGKNGDLRIGGCVFAYLYRPIDSIRVGYLEGKLLGKTNIPENVFNSSFLLLREHRMDYLFICPVYFPDKDYGASLFGIKNKKVYKIYSVKDWERHTYQYYCIPLDTYIDYYDKMEELDLKQYE
ncbi:MAG: hypothetical protein ACTTKO_05680 [Candidatus Limimorpha sp.]|uniref:hypothetical protein n=1 Tax=Prevotella heparinolytica TaxID=28113 RepID=UPI0035A13350